MKPLAAVRLGDALVLAARDEADLATGPWGRLSPGLEGRDAAGWSRHALGWDPEASEEGLAPLSLYEHGEYLARVAPGARWAPALASVVTPLPPDLGGEGLSRVNFRGRAGGATLAAFDRGGRALFSLPVEVRTRKLDHLSDYRAMLDDLAEARFGAALSLTEAPTDLPVAPGGPRVPSLWDDYLLVRHVVRSGLLARALDTIARDPVRHLQMQRRVVPTARATRLRPEDLASRATGAGLPRTVAESAPEPTLDTPENRFVAHALGAFAQRALELSSRARDGALRAAAEGLARELLALRGRAFLRGVGALATASTLGSASLQRRPGYREVLSAWLCLEGGLRPSWRDPAALREGVRDTSWLYEQWCGLALSSALGLHPAALLDCGEGPRALLATVGGATVTVWRQREFPRGVGSYTLAFRPDFSIECDGLWLHLDAKYQLGRAGDFLDEALEGEALVPRAGLLKMHAYRDAIRGSWGAYALFPGDDPEPTWFEAPGARGGGVGALPLRPGGWDEGRAAQREALSSLVERFVVRAREGEGA